VQYPGVHEAIESDLVREVMCAMFSAVMLKASTPRDSSTSAGSNAKNSTTD
jgi:hypothetical protein